MQPESMLLVRNPRARRAPSEAALRSALLPLRAAGVTLELRSTTAPGHARELATEAAQDGVEVVVAVGGDGTVHEVANGLAGSETALAVVPAGTANVWAKEAGIPSGVERVLAWLPEARRARIDLGRAEVAGGSERYFLLMCSAGIDAEVVKRVGEGGWRKRWLGRAWYALVGLERGLRAPPVQTRIDVDSEAIERPLLFAVAGNTRLYGGLVRLTSDARVDDGLLDLVAFSGRGLPARLRLTARALRGGLHDGLGSLSGGGIDYLRGADVRIEAERPLAVQADGEYIGETPLSLGVAARALSVLLARGPQPLLPG